MRLYGQNFTGRLIGRRGSLTLLLILLNVLCFGLQTLLDWVSPNWVEHWLALSRAGVSQGYLWQFLSYMFLHGGVFHLLVNMLTLYFAGREVESLVGPLHFLGIYFLGGIIGAMAQLLMVADGGALLGASAGVFAVLIAFTTIFPEIEITCLIFFVIPVKLKARKLAWIVVGSTLLFIATGALQEVGHFAHLGGCLVGWIYAKRLGFGNPPRLQAYFSRKRDLAERIRTMSPEQFISEEIDPILDKIARHGIHSLTRMERKILEKGRDKIAGKLH